MAVYERTMYTNKVNDWQKIVPMLDNNDWQSKEVNDTLFPEREYPFFYTGHQRSGQGRSSSGLKDANQKDSFGI